MHQPASRTLAHHGARILRLGLPLVANNLATMGMGFTDTVMAGRLGGESLAAVAVGNTLWFSTYLAGLGILMAVSPITAHALGAGRQERVGQVLRQSLWLAAVLGLAGIGLLQFSRPVFLALGVDPAIVPLTGAYVSAMSWGLPAVLGYLCFRFMSEGMGHTRPIMYFAFIGLAVNALGNWVFMYGKLGFPAMGAVGCGVATALTSVAMFAAMLAYVLRAPRYRHAALRPLLAVPRWQDLREILALGVPLSASVLAESMFFHATALIMAALGTSIVAAHQVALNYAATMFMVPLALHSATTVRVGHLLGRGLPGEARRAGAAGILLCVGFMAVSAAVMYAGRQVIAGFYTPDPQVVALAAALLVPAALFQVFDGANIGALGALRGYRDTRVPLLLAALAYWAVGFPLAWYMAFVAGAGPVGVWQAMLVSLAVCAVLLVWRFAVTARRELTRPA